MSGCDPRRGTFTVRGLVVKEDIGAKGFEERALVASAQKKHLIDPDIPGPKRPDDPFMSRRCARCHQCRPDRYGFFWEFGLDLVQGGQKVPERASRQWFPCLLGFPFGKGAEPLFPVDAFGLVRENDGIGVERDPQFRETALAGLARNDGGCGMTTLEGFPDRLGIGRQE